MTSPQQTMEQRLADLEQQVRSLRAGNLTQFASVVDASGNSVPLSNLAFGEVAAYDGAAVNFGGNPSTSGTTNDALHFTPSAVAYVSSGRLRIDWSANMTANTGGGNSANATMGISCLGPFPTAAAAQAAAPVPLGGAVPAGLTVTGPVNTLTVEADGAGTELVVNAGTFGIVTGLAKGFWLVYPYYQFTWDSTNSASAFPAGGPRRRTVAVTPY